MAYDLTFGGWKDKTDAPYTQMFAKIGKTDGRPQPDSNSDNPRAHTSPARGARPEQVASRGKSERQGNHGRQEHHQVITDSPLHRNPNSAKAARRTGSGSAHSTESSPRDPRAPGAALRHRGAPNQTPGRSKLASSFDSPPEEGAVISRIGDWDPNDPDGDKITGKFQRIRSEKEKNSEKVPSIEVEPRSHRDGHDPWFLRFCCFGWCRRGVL